MRKHRVPDLRKEAVSVDSHVDVYYDLESLRSQGRLAAWERFVYNHPHGGFFQSREFFSFAEGVSSYKPILLIKWINEDEMAGALLGVLQWNGKSLVARLSRRLIIWGGPLLSKGRPSCQIEAARRLLAALVQQARRRAIYIEFRNLFDCSGIHSAFTDNRFMLHPHLNYVVRLNEAVPPRWGMSPNRVRQVQSSLKKGARVVEPGSEEDIKAFYEILHRLYREKVCKPLPDAGFFIHFWRSGMGKVFLIKFDSQVIGGIVCPFFGNKIIYECYICGEDAKIKGIYPSVMATWAPIAYGQAHGFQQFDFLGAGRPDEDYGVRDFKARFGGVQVQYGRYQLILHPHLYQLGKLGLNIYHKIR